MKGQPMRYPPTHLAAAVAVLFGSPVLAGSLPDTGQTLCYDDRNEITCPAVDAPFYGQDAQYEGNAPRYLDNGDGTILDRVTGLTWQQSPDHNDDGVIDSADKLSIEDAETLAAALELGGYDDWRLPSITELYSLIDFDGDTGLFDPGSSGSVPADAVPYIDTDYFAFGYGDTTAGERYIDAQYWSSTAYVSTLFSGQAAHFGVNFADGRIKGYPIADPQTGAGSPRYVRLVRGSGYAGNDFADNGDATVTDAATGLMWLQNDSGYYSAGPYGDGSMNWQQSLAWCEDLELAGHDDWRLPNAKELQSLVDYTRSPDTTGSAAIDPLFHSTYLSGGINDSGGVPNYPYYWTGTSHRDGPEDAKWAVYLAFGEARGYMSIDGGTQLLDVHGAGAQRSDPKSGDPGDYAGGNGPQGDVVGIYNYARCVRAAAEDDCDLDGNGAMERNDVVVFVRRCLAGDESLNCDRDGNGTLQRKDVVLFVKSCT